MVDLLIDLTDVDLFKIFVCDRFANLLTNYKVNRRKNVFGVIIMNRKILFCLFFEFIFFFPLKHQLKEP